MIRCSKCKTERPETSFTKDARKNNNRASWCIPCYADDNRRRRLADPEHHKMLANRRSHPKKLRKYGLTEASYEALLLSQEGVCGICDRPERIADRRLAIDHCHTTGRVRGLLCFDCNAAIGKLGDSPARLRRAASYLEAAK